jgi:two-component system nitrate/nitrite response regulator NarL
VTARGSDAGGDPVSTPGPGSRRSRPRVVPRDGPRRPVTAGEGLQVLLVGRSVVLRKGLAALLAELPQVAETVAVANPPDGLSVTQRWRPDLLLASADPDPRLERLVVAVHDLGAKVVVVLPVSEPATLENAVRLQADGFVLVPELDRGVLARTLGEVLRGEVPVPQAMGKLAVSALQERIRPEPEVRLTQREQQVMVLLARGLSNREIARRLGVSEHGAKRHVGRILAKLDSPNRTTAVGTAYRLGLIDEIG